MYDPKKHLMLPIYDFFTSSHDISTVRNYLLSFMDILDKNVPSKYSKLPSVIVTDFSWVLLNSINIAFNKLTILEYLKITFSEIMEKKNPKFM